MEEAVVQQNESSIGQAKDKADPQTFSSLGEFLGFFESLVERERNEDKKIELHIFPKKAHETVTNVEVKTVQEKSTCESEPITISQTFQIVEVNTTSTHTTSSNESVVQENVLDESGLRVEHTSDVCPLSTITHSSDSLSEKLAENLVITETCQDSDIVKEGKCNDHSKVDEFVNLTGSHDSRKDERANLLIGHSKVTDEMPNSVSLLPDDIAQGDISNYQISENCKQNNEAQQSAESSPITYHYILDDDLEQLNSSSPILECQSGLFNVTIKKEPESMAFGEIETAINYGSSRQNDLQITTTEKQFEQITSELDEDSESFVFQNNESSSSEYSQRKLFDSSQHSGKTDEKAESESVKNPQKRSVGRPKKHKKPKPPKKGFLKRPPGAKPLGRPKGVKTFIRKQGTVETVKMQGDMNLGIGAILGEGRKSKRVQRKHEILYQKTLEANVRDKKHKNMKGNDKSEVENVLLSLEDKISQSENCSNIYSESPLDQIMIMDARSIAEQQFSSDDYSVEQILNPSDVQTRPECVDFSVIENMKTEITSDDEHRKLEIGQQRKLVINNKILPHMKNKIKKKELKSVEAVEKQICKQSKTDSPEDVPVVIENVFGDVIYVVGEDNTDDITQEKDMDVQSQQDVLYNATKHNEVENLIDASHKTYPTHIVQNAYASFNNSDNVENTGDQLPIFYIATSSTQNVLNPINMEQVSYIGTTSGNEIQEDSRTSKGTEADNSFFHSLGLGPKNEVQQLYKRKHDEPTHFSDFPLKKQKYSTMKKTDIRLLSKWNRAKGRRKPFIEKKKENLKTDNNSGQTKKDKKKKPDMRKFKVMRPTEMSDKIMMKKPVGRPKKVKDADVKLIKPKRGRPKKSEQKNVEISSKEKTIGSGKKSEGIEMSKHSDTKLKLKEKKLASAFKKKALNNKINKIIAQTVSKAKLIASKRKFKTGNPIATIQPKKRGRPKKVKDVQENKKLELSSITSFDPLKEETPTNVKIKKKRGRPKRIDMQNISQLSSKTSSVDGKDSGDKPVSLIEKGKFIDFWNSKRAGRQHSKFPFKMRGKHKVTLMNLEIPLERLPIKLPQLKNKISMKKKKRGRPKKSDTEVRKIKNKKMPILKPMIEQLLSAEREVVSEDNEIQRKDKELDLAMSSASHDGKLNMIESKEAQNKGVDLQTVVETTEQATSENVMEFDETVACRDTQSIDNNKNGTTAKSSELTKNSSLMDTHQFGDEKAINEGKGLEEGKLEQSMSESVPKISQSYIKESPEPNLNLNVIPLKTPKETPARKNLGISISLVSKELIVKPIEERTSFSSNIKEKDITFKKNELSKSVLDSIPQKSSNICNVFDLKKDFVAIPRYDVKNANDQSKNTIQQNGDIVKSADGAVFEKSAEINAGQYVLLLKKDTKPHLNMLNIGVPLTITSRNSLLKDIPKQGTVPKDLSSLPKTDATSGDVSCSLNPIKENDVSNPQGNKQSLVTSKKGTNTPTRGVDSCSLNPIKENDVSNPQENKQSLVTSKKGTNTPTRGVDSCSLNAIKEKDESKPKENKSSLVTSKKGTNTPPKKKVGRPRKQIFENVKKDHGDELIESSMSETHSDHINSELREHIKIKGGRGRPKKIKTFDIDGQDTSLSQKLSKDVSAVEQNEGSLKTKKTMNDVIGKKKWISVDKKLFKFLGTKFHSDVRNNTKAEMKEKSTSLEPKTIDTVKGTNTNKSIVDASDKSKNCYDMDCANDNDKELEQDSQHSVKINSVSRCSISSLDCSVTTKNTSKTSQIEKGDLTLEEDTLKCSSKCADDTLFNLEGNTHEPCESIFGSQHHGNKNINVYNIVDSQKNKIVATCLSTDDEMETLEIEISDKSPKKRGRPPKMPVLVMEKMENMFDKIKKGREKKVSTSVKEVRKIMEGNSELLIGDRNNESLIKGKKRGKVGRPKKKHLNNSDEVGSKESLAITFNDTIGLDSEKQHPAVKRKPGRPRKYPFLFKKHGGINKKSTYQKGIRKNNKLFISKKVEQFPGTQYMDHMSLETEDNSIVEQTTKVKILNKTVNTVSKAVKKKYGKVGRPKKLQNEQQKDKLGKRQITFSSGSLCDDSGKSVKTNELLTNRYQNDKQSVDEIGLPELHSNDLKLKDLGDNKECETKIKVMGVENIVEYLKGSDKVKQTNEIGARKIPKVGRPRKISLNECFAATAAFQSKVVKVKNSHKLNEKSCTSKGKLNQDLGFKKKLGRPKKIVEEKIKLIKISDYVLGRPKKVKFHCNINNPVKRGRPKKEHIQQLHIVKQKFEDISISTDTTDGKNVSNTEIKEKKVVESESDIATCIVENKPVIFNEKATNCPKKDIGKAQQGETNVSNHKTEKLVEKHLKSTAMTIKKNSSPGKKKKNASYEDVLNKIKVHVSETPKKAKRGRPRKKTLDINEDMPKLELEVSVTEKNKVVEKEVIARDSDKKSSSGEKQKSLHRIGNIEQISGIRKTTENVYVDNETFLKLKRMAGAKQESCKSNTNIKCATPKTFQPMGQSVTPKCNDNVSTSKLKTATPVHGSVNSMENCDGNITDLPAKTSSPQDMLNEELTKLDCDFEVVFDVNDSVKS